MKRDNSTLIRPYQPANWSSICAIHNLARPDELAGSCNPKAFISINEDTEAEHLKSCSQITFRSFHSRLLIDDCDTGI